MAAPAPKQKVPPASSKPSRAVKAKVKYVEIFSDDDDNDSDGYQDNQDDNSDWNNYNVIPK